MSTLRNFLFAAAAMVATTATAGFPPAPSTPALHTSDDTGSSSLDHVTKNTQPRFLGTCVPGLEIMLSNGGSFIGQTICNAQGIYVVTPWAPIADGTHPFIHTTSWDLQTNEGGSSSGSISITIDTTAPVAPGTPDLSDSSDSGYSNTDNITKITNPLFYVFGAEADATLKLYVGGVVKSSRTGPGSMPTTGLPAGTHGVFVQQVDDAGNVGPNSQLDIVIDTTAPPQTAIYLDDSTDSGKSDSDKLTRYQQLKLYIPSADNPRHEVFRDGVTIGMSALNSLFYTAAVPAGDYTTTFTSRQIDLAGNVGPLNNGVTVHVDTVKPATPSLAPDLLPSTDNGTKNFDNVTSLSALTFKLQASNESNLLLLKRNGIAVPNALRYGSGDVSAVGILGSSTYTAFEFDDAGNESLASPSTTVTVVDGKPTASDDVYTVAVGGTLTLSAPGVIANDSDFEGKPLTATKTSNAVFGNVVFNANGTFTYTAGQGIGPDLFTYKVSNGTLESTDARVDIQVVAAVPNITSISPSSGSYSQSHVITLGGQNFQSGASIHLGASYLDNVSANGTTASGALYGLSVQPGTLHDVKLKNPDDGFFVVKNGFMADFADVAQAHSFHDFVESIFRAGITAGCGGGNYCPDALVTRGQMSVFILRAKYGSSFAPSSPAVATFSDVPVDSPFAPWIEKLKADEITAGCGGGNYCPESSITRQQMAVFLLVAKEGSSYVPPPATGTFADVSMSDPFAPWIEELAKRGITAGCGNGNFCPNAPVNRGQMAVFLKTTFNLP